jgi:hypothetical protein
MGEDARRPGPFVPGADEMASTAEQDGQLRDPTVIFLHIGKTAGTTLRQILRRNFRSADVMVIRARGRPREETLERFASLPAETRAQPRLIMGHTVFGLHEHVPRPSTYITILRKPYSLVVSQYRFVMRTPGHRHHDLVTSRGLSIEEYIRGGVSLEMDNSQTRAIAGDLSTPFGACTDQMLDRAKRNLEERFAVAGLTERFDETLILMSKVFGWSRLHYVRANVAPQRDHVEITDEARALIAEHNRLDDELYAFATERFDDALLPYPSFADDVAHFKRANARFRPWGVLTQSYPRQLASRLGVRRGSPKSSVRDL